MSRLYGTTVAGVNLVFFNQEMSELFYIRNKTLLRPKANKKESKMWVERGQITTKRADLTSRSPACSPPTPNDGVVWWGGCQTKQCSSHLFLHQPTPLVVSPIYYRGPPRRCRRRFYYPNSLRANWRRNKLFLLLSRDS